MALPNAENLAYRGQTSGNARCMAYRGFFCDSVVQAWQEVVSFIVYVRRIVRIYVDR